MEKNPHHLVLGELIDFLTGEKRVDTHDERYRQQIGKFLVRELGYAKEQIQTNQELSIRVDRTTARIKIDFLITDHDKTCVMVKYAPGSLVTRRLTNLALSRIIHPYQIPLVVTTNGEDAEIIQGTTGRVTGQGLAGIPSPKDIQALDPDRDFPAISDVLYEKASRIAYACEVDGSCYVNDDFKCSNWYCYPTEKPENK